MSAMLRSVALAALCAFSAWSGAAEIRGDRVLLCDRERDVSEALRPGTLMEAAVPAIARSAHDDAIGAVTAAYEQSLTAALRAQPDVGKFVEVLRGAAKEDAQTFQIGPALGGRNAELLFRNTGLEIAFDCEKLEQYQVDMASTSLVVAVILAQRTIPAFAARAEAIATQSRLHENLVKNGLPMWPWELWLNGKRLGEGDASPLFRRQVVLLRPSAGVEINTRDQRSADMDASLALELLGFVQYTDDSYSRWWGLSAVVTTTTGNGMGYGALLRYQNYSIGVTRHKAEAPGEPDDTYLMLNIDLYDLVQKKRAELPEFKQWARAQARELAASAVAR